VSSPEFSQPGTDTADTDSIGVPGPSTYRGQPEGLVSVPRVNRIAIAAVICGLGQFALGLLIFGNILLAIPALVLGAIGMRQTAARGEQGRSLAIAGLVLGILGIVYFCIVILLVVIISERSH
jgi:hypothetical protein